MTISPSPSAASVVEPSPKSVPSLQGVGANFLIPRSTHQAEGSQATQPETASQLSGSVASHALDAGTSTCPPPSQEIASQSPRRFHLEPHPETSPSTTPPIFIARDFAYQPAPKIPSYPVDEKWAVRTYIVNTVPGTRERLAEQWEMENRHLFRKNGNRADPPNTIPKTWGGRSKAEDENLMRQAQQRVQNIERRKQHAAALGFLPTRLLDGYPRDAVHKADFDPEAAARAEASKRIFEAEALAAGYGPLTKTPPGTPPPDLRPPSYPLALPPPAPPPAPPIAPPPAPPIAPPPAPAVPSGPPPPPPPPSLFTFGHSPSPRRSKRKPDASANELDGLEVTTDRGRKRQRSDTHPADEPGPSNPGRYFLRHRRRNGTDSIAPSAESSPEDKGKGKGKGKRKRKDQ